jgi:EamA-like transporter family
MRPMGSSNALHAGFAAISRRRHARRGTARGCAARRRVHLRLSRADAHQRVAHGGISLYVAFVSYLIWFWLLTRYIASRLSVFSFVKPLFGVTFGVLLLGESFSVRFLLACIDGAGRYCISERTAAA